MKNSKALWMLTVALGISSSAFAESDQTVKFADVIELSGAGATVGTNWRNASSSPSTRSTPRAASSAARSSSRTTTPRPTRASSRAQVQKALDTKPYVVVGPIFSGSVKVNMQLAQQAEMPNSPAPRRPSITQAGNPYVFRTSSVSRRRCRRSPTT